MQQTLRAAAEPAECLTEMLPVEQVWLLGLFPQRELLPVPAAAQFQKTIEPFHTHFYVSF